MIKVNKEVLNKYLIFLIIPVITLWALAPLIMPGFFSMHDDQQIARLFELNKIIHEGQIPPRWSPNLGFGYGFPIFIFYPPLVYYFGFVFHSIGFSLIDSTKIVMALGFVLSAIFMFLWVSNKFGKISGLISAILYTYAPYHALDLYVRGAFSEFFSFVWIPAVFWAFDKLAETKSIWYSLLSGIIISFVILTHLLVALQFIPFLLLYVLFIIAQERKKKRHMAGLFLISGIIGMGLSAYFWLPAFVEKDYTLVDTILTRELASYHIHFVCIRQLFNSVWGYGGSVQGWSDGLSFEIGKMHTVIVAASLLVILSKVINNKKLKNLAFPAFIFSLFGLSVFLTTKYSKFIWDLVQPLSYIQFPWRFLLFSVLFSSFLGGFIYSEIAKFFSRKYLYLTIPIFYLFSVYLVFDYYRPEKYLDVQDEYYTTNNDIQWRVSSMSYEYVPKQVKTVQSEINTTKLDITKEDIPTSFYEVKSGIMNVQHIKNLSWKKELIADVKEAGELQINTYAFPGWLVEVNGKVAKYNTDNPLYLISIPLNTGRYHVRVIFENTPIRNFSNFISLTFTLLVISYFIFFRFFKHRHFK
jgi:hypothetical protein